ncbi:hypothetical protein STPE111643_08730 [Streptococcus penaeicida]
MFTQFQVCYLNKMDNIVKKVETFLAFSEEKLEELKAKNQALKEEMDPQEDI